jgi:tetratricopeptide (TPR) repeat protein
MTWANKGACLYELGKYEDALKSLDKAIKINPKNANAWYNASENYVAINQKDKAIEMLKKAVELDNTFKEQAIKSDALKALQNDEEFKKIMQQ